jgi:hypothetical protein
MPKRSKRWPAKPGLSGFESHRCLHYFCFFFLRSEETSTQMDIWRRQMLYNYHYLLGNDPATNCLKSFQRCGLETGKGVAATR